MMQSFFFTVTIVIFFLMLLKKYFEYSLWIYSCLELHSKTSKHICVYTV